MSSAPSLRLNTVPVTCKCPESVLLLARLRGLPMPRSGPGSDGMKSSSRSPCAVCLALTGSWAPGTRVLRATFRTVRLLLLQAAGSSTNEKARQTRNFVLQAARIGGIMHKAAPCSGRPTRPEVCFCYCRTAHNAARCHSPRISPSSVQERNSKRTCTPPGTPSPHSA